MVSPNSFQDHIVKEKIDNESDAGNSAHLNLLINAKSIFELQSGKIKDEVTKEDTLKALVRCQQEIAVLANKIGWTLSGIMEEGLK